MDTTTPTWITIEQNRINEINKLQHLQGLKDAAKQILDEIEILEGKVKTYNLSEII